MEFSLSHLFFISLLLFFLYLFFRLFYLAKALKFPPSPPLSLPILGHLYLLKKPLYQTLAKISEKYGPILLLHFGSHRVLLVSSPSAAEECFTKNDIVFANRPRLLAGKHLGYGYTTLVWASYGDLWRNLRRIATVEMLSAHLNYKDEIIRGLMQVMLTAGTDTSASTMEWAMSLLLNNPEALTKVRVEIDRQIGFSRLVDDSDLHLPYTHGIIKETLRMCPVAPHESSSDCIVGGYRVPAGTMLLVNALAIQRDPKVWDDPMKCEPHRFVDLKGRKEGSFELMPFGYGRRGCPGENLALRVVGLALASLIQCFEWARVDWEMVDLTGALGLNMPKALPLVAKCRPRLAAGGLIKHL